GVDVHPPGIGTLLRGIAEQNLTNVRVFQGDASDILRECIADGELDRMLIFFPDPWHKKRHHKRRLIQADFVQLLRRKLRPGAVLHLATDWHNYAQQMLEVMSAAEGFTNLAGKGEFAGACDRPQTRFERRGLKLGHGVWDLLFTRTL
ncbi:MAG: tRNA (guanosine(46)-N7)-methyltransferase TrmB, partial [Pseudohongiellaceae bacterium]